MGCEFKGLNGAPCQLRAAITHRTSAGERCALHLPIQDLPKDTELRSALGLEGAKIAQGLKEKGAPIADLEGLVIFDQRQIQFLCQIAQELGLLVRFLRCTFLVPAHFPANTHKLIQVRWCSFHESVTFKAGSNFIDIEGSTFEDKFTVTGRVADYGLSLSRSVFKGQVDCSNIEWQRTFEVWKCEFHQDVDFSAPDNNTHYLPKVVRFEECMCKLWVDFSNCRFTDSVYFFGTTFYRAPMFHGAIWPSRIHLPLDGFKDISGDAAPAYRVLRHAMHTVQNRNLEGFFHVLEQRSLRRAPDTYSRTSLISWFYDVSARYGTSIGRPFMWIGIVTLASFVFYASVSSDAICAIKGLVGECTLSPSTLWNAAKFTLTQTFRPFDVLAPHQMLRYDGETAFAQPDWYLYVAGVMQSTITLALLAVLFVSLRWRFKRD